MSNTSPQAGVPPPSATWRRTVLLLTTLLVALSLPDLFSPPISPTILRQTQTFSQTVNFVGAGFSLHGLAVDLDGPVPVGTAHEFPIYQTIVGGLFKALGPSFFAGKLVSLIAMTAALLAGLRLVRERWGEASAARAGFFLAACPITLLMSTAFQPDAVAIALGALAAAAFVRWKESPGLAQWALFLALLLLAALAKFTVLVPFIPLAVGATLFHRGGFRMPTVAEAAAFVLILIVPFVAWSIHRTTLTDPRWLSVEGAMFLVGDLTRFLNPLFLAKLAFILGAMVLCGAGIPLAALGLRGRDAAHWLLVCGIPFYYLLIPTAAEQTYYALPVVPALALLGAKGSLWIEERLPQRRRATLAVVVVAWLGGLAVAGPYTLRHDNVSLDAARAVASVSAPGELILVANMHDRGVGIGGFNSTIMTLSGRRGWNVSAAEPTAGSLAAQAEARRAEGARWMVVTWFTPELEPWVNRFLPAAFSRVPRVHGMPVDGASLADTLASGFPVAARGPNFAVLSLE